MSNEIITQENKLPCGYTQDQIDLITKTVAPGLTKEELFLFLHVCHKTGLDALCRQAYAIKRGGRMCIQTGIDGLRLIAERTGCYAPGKETEFLYDEKGALVAARVHIKKMTKDGTWHEMANTAFMQEYSTGQNLWKTLPRVMLAKVSEAALLRRAFAADLSGLYVAEEMEQADIVEVKIDKDPAIDESTYSMLDAYLNGYSDLREKLKKLCGINDLKKIKTSQLSAVREYTRRYIAEMKTREAIVQQAVAQTQEEAYNES